MTHEETIKALDKLIAYLNSAILEVKLSRHFKDNVIRRLREINISNATINTVANIEIEEYNSNSLSHYVMELQHLEKDRIERNKQSIQSMIDILKVEQERHKRELDFEAQQRTIEEQKKNIELQQVALTEQKKGNKIMTWTLWTSVVAIIIALISLIVAICK
jgi:hypothetical protein